MHGFRTDLQRKRDLLGNGLRADGFEVYQPQGTYFITTAITPLGVKDAYAFCRALPERCGVVAIPNSVFYDDPDAGCGAWLRDITVPWWRGLLAAPLATANFDVHRRRASASTVTDATQRLRKAFTESGHWSRH